MRQSRRQDDAAADRGHRQSGTRVITVQAGSVADRVGIRSGDRLLALNGHEIHDVIDYWFHQSVSRLRIEWLRGDCGDCRVNRTVRKPEHEALGVELESFSVQRCRNKCVFCFVHQLPCGLRRELYLKDEDYRLSFLHGNYITCTNLSPEDLERIARMRLSPLYISIHATDETVRRCMLGRSSAEPIMPILKWLTRRRIAVHGQIVLCPGMNDGAVLLKTLSDLADLGTRLESLAIVPVGLTAHRERLQRLQPVTPAYARRFLGDLALLRSTLSPDCSHSRLYASDEFYLLSGRLPPKYNSADSLPQISNGVGMYHRFYESFGHLRRTLPRRLSHSRKVGVISTWMGARVIDRLVREMNRTVQSLKIRVLPTENTLFGPAVTVTGLLPGRDILRTICANPGLDHYVIPGNALRPWDDRFIDDMTLAQLVAESGAASILAGDESCTGFANAVLSDPAQGF